MKSIRSYLVTRFTISIAVVFIAAFGMTYYNVQRDFNNIKERSIRNTVQDASKNLTAQIQAMYAKAEAIAADPDIYTTEKGFADKKDKLIKYAEQLSINSIGYITDEGYLTSTDGFENDISERQYFTDMMAGKYYISNPSFNTSTNKQIIFIGVPLYEDGKTVGAMTCTFDSTYLSELITQVNYEEQGEVYMVSAEGNVIACVDTDYVLNNYNIIEAAKEDSSLQELADAHEKILAEENGTIEVAGEKLFFEKVDDSNGWKIIFRIKNKLFNKEKNAVMKIFGICAAAGMVLVVIVAVTVGGILGRRMSNLKLSLEEVAAGNFCIEIDEKEKKRKDEIGAIYQSMEETISAIRTTLQAVKSSVVSLEEQTAILIDTSGTLTNNTDTVTSSVSEIQAGNTEQATEINNINAEMERFNENIEKVNDNITGVVAITSSASDKLVSGNEEMTKLQESFKTFNKQFEEFRVILETVNNNLSSITVITSTIGDIASQTNLLSLNASIEAARAGEVGKGFSVVAQEIGKLAEQSETSAQEISSVVKNIMSSEEQLIESTASMDAQVQKQQEVLQATLESFSQLSKDIEEMFPQIEGISRISEENLVACKTIGDSIQNANAISEELVATTMEVGGTCDGFQNSSNQVSAVSEKVQQLSHVMTEQTDQFQV